MQYLWLLIIVGGAVPLAYVAWLLNPFLLLLFGPDWWHDRMARLQPHRWRLTAVAVIWVVAATVYIRRYA
jgi:hypothetical protein